MLVCKGTKLVCYNAESAEAASLGSKAALLKAERDRHMIKHPLLELRPSLPRWPPAAVPKLNAVVAKLRLLDNCCRTLLQIAARPQAHQNPLCKNHTSTTGNNSNRA